MSIIEEAIDEGNQIGEPYSMNDWKKQIEAIAGVNPELLGKSNETSSY